MNVYKEMYFKLFNTLTDVIGELQAAQQQAEETIPSEESEHEAAQISSECKGMDGCPVPL